MKELAGKTAFITGGASGIGLGMARAFAKAGMKVMLADIEPTAMDKAVKELSAVGPQIRGTLCDVADPQSVESAAQAAFAAFGNVHVLCNNAGVYAPHRLEDVSLESWRWQIDVNLMGVVHGIKSFLPHMLGHGEEGHIVNTSSIGGLTTSLGFSPYTASKFGVLGMSEGLALQLQPHRIGVTILCPSYVRTEIVRSGRNRQQQYGKAAFDPASSESATQTEIQSRIDVGMDPAIVGEMVLQAIKENRLYQFTHPGERTRVEPRFSAILAAADSIKA